MKHALVAALCALALAGCSTPGPEPATGEPELPQQDELVAGSPPAPEEPVLSVDDTYTAISLNVRAGDPLAALEAYQEAELENPDEPATRLLLVNLYLIAGSVDEAEALLSEILRADPDDTQALHLQSLIAAARGDQEGQKSALLRIVELEPGNAQALASLGEIELQERNLDAAEDRFVAALEQDESDVVARMGLGNVYLRREEYEAAEEEFTAVIERDPGYAFSYGDRARARALRRNFSGAVSDLTEAISLDPEYQWHYIDRGRVYLEQRRFADAVNDFSAAIAIDGSSFIGYVLRARAYDAEDEYDAAREDYARVLEMRPDYYPAYAPYATLLYMEKRPVEAADYFKQAFQTDSRRLDFALLAALSLKAGNRESAANDWVSEHLAQFPRDSLYYTMARYYLLPGNEGYVLAEINQEQDDVVKGQMYFYLAAQLELLGRTETARAAFLEAEDTLSPGFVERRLASWHLDSYRSGQEGE